MTGTFLNFQQNNNNIFYIPTYTQRDLSRPSDQSLLLALPKRSSDSLAPNCVPQFTFLHGCTQCPRFAFLILIP